MRRMVRWLLSLSVLVAACGSEDGAPVWSSPQVRPVVGALTVRVWVCRVPPGSTAPEYEGLSLRHEVDPAAIAAEIGPGLDQYFSDVSLGALRLAVVTGGDVAMTVDDGPQECVDAARASTPADEVVLALADADHGAGQSGGFGGIGDGDSAGAAYVGGDELASRPGPLRLALFEHELGHVIGWVHSAYDPAVPVDVRYASAIDVMSDAWAPARLEPSTIHGPDTLAIDRLLVGWLPIDEVATVGTGRTTVVLAPSAGPAVPGAHRLAVLPLGPGRFATFEWLLAEGYDRHLPESGIAVHEVTVVDGSVTDVEPLHDAAPFTDLLQAGDRLEVSGRTLHVGALVDGTVTVVVDAG